MMPFEVVWAFFFLLCTCVRASDDWVIYTQFSGYLPSYTYPLSLSAGDQVVGNLSWTGTRDLDLYLYKDGSDLLNRSSLQYLARQFSGSKNPQILNYTIQQTGIYYFRVDLFSSIPTSYMFEIYVNDEVIGTYFDDLVTVTTGRTVKLVDFHNQCMAKIIYDGTSANIHLMEGGQDIANDTYSIASNFSTVNPKEIVTTVDPISYSLVIHHSLISTNALLEFNVTILTPQNTSKCLSKCDQIPYALNLEFNSLERCVCRVNFVWIGQQCVINCASMDGNLGISPGTIDKCLCPSNYIWNIAGMVCVIDCQGLNSTGKVGPIVGSQIDTCTCAQNYTWVAQSKSCVFDCQIFNISGDVGLLSTTEEETCTCLKENHLWNLSIFACAIQCSEFNQTGKVVSNNETDPYSCICAPNFYWDSSQSKCLINCSLLNISGNIGQSSSDVSCECLTQNYVWLNDSLLCAIDCEGLNSSGRVMGRQGGSWDLCLCVDNFQWDGGEQKCFLDCGGGNQNGYVGGLVPGSQDQCECVFSYFFWDLEDFSCKINCSSFNGSGLVVGPEPNSIDSCVCAEPSIKINSSFPSFECIVCQVPNCNTCVLGETNICEICSQGFQLSETRQQCIQNCGDLIAVFHECDNHLGNQFDGCDDLCHIMDGFTCGYNGNLSICSFNDTLKVKFISMEEKAPENKLSIIVQVYPPLHVFKTSTNSELSQIFKIASNSLEQQSLQYDPQTGKLSFICLLKQGHNFLDQSFDLLFKPSESEAEQYFATIDDSFSIKVPKHNFFFYSQTQILISEILEYTSFATAGLGLVFFIAGIFARKLAGLQSILVCQFTYVAFVQANTAFLFPFGSFSPLKFASGYNVPIMPEQTASGITLQAPYISQLALSTNIINNFNISFVLLLLALVFALITFVRFRKSYKQGIPLQPHSPKEKVTKVQLLETKGSNSKQKYFLFAMGLVMAISTFNLVYFTESAALMLRSMLPFNLPGIVITAFYSGIILCVFIVYLLKYEYFKNFNESFKPTTTAKIYYPILWICMISAVLLNVFLEGIIFSGLIPLSLLLLYTVILRPYSQTKDNIRSTFNCLVLCLVSGFRVYINYTQLSQINSLITYYILIILASGLIVSTLVAAIFIVWSFVHGCRKETLMKEEDEEVNKIMRDLTVNQMGHTFRNSSRTLMQALGSPKSDIINQSQLSKVQKLGQLSNNVESQKDNTLNVGVSEVNNQIKGNIKDQLKKLKIMKGSFDKVQRSKCYTNVNDGENSTGVKFMEGGIDAQELKIDFDQI